MCMECALKMPRRELERFKEMEAANSFLMVHQRARFATLEQRVLNHRLRNRTVGAPPEHQERRRTVRRNQNQNRHGKRRGPASTIGGGYNRFRRTSRDLCLTWLPYGDKQSYRDAMSPLVELTNNGQSFRVRNVESYGFDGRTASGQEASVLMKRMMFHLYPDDPVETDMVVNETSP